jgi:hypothetical protein
MFVAVPHTVRKNDQPETTNYNPWPPPFAVLHSREVTIPHYSLLNWRIFRRFGPGSRSHSEHQLIFRVVLVLASSGAVTAAGDVLAVQDRSFIAGHNHGALVLAGDRY